MDFVVERRSLSPTCGLSLRAVRADRAAPPHGTLRVTRIRAHDLLRHEVFVDLYAVVRQAVRISQKSYSIKKFEPFYEFERQTDLRRGDDSIVMFESWARDGRNGDPRRDRALQTTTIAAPPTSCASGLLERRTERESELGTALPWRGEPEPPKDKDDAELDELAARLLDGISEPLDLAEMREAGEAVRARWLLAHFAPILSARR